MAAVIHSCSSLFLKMGVLPIVAVFLLFVSIVSVAVSADSRTLPFPSGNAILNRDNQPLFKHLEEGCSQWEGSCEGKYKKSEECPEKQAICKEGYYRCPSNASEAPCCVPEKLRPFLCSESVMDIKPTPDTELKPTPHTKSSTDVKPDAEPKSDTKPKPDIKPTPNTKPTLDIEPKTSADVVKPDAEPKTNAEWSPDTEPKTEVKTSTDAQSTQEAESKIEIKPITEIESKPDAEPKTEVKTSTDDEPTPNTESKPEEPTPSVVVVEDCPANEHHIDCPKCPEWRCEDMDISPASSSDRSNDAGFTHCFNADHCGRARCYCNEGFARIQNGSCVPASLCQRSDVQKLCGPNTEFDSCPLFFDIKCTDAKKKLTNPLAKLGFLVTTELQFPVGFLRPYCLEETCRCKFGYARNEEGYCAPIVDKEKCGAVH